MGGRSRALQLITPKPWRGPLIAAGAVPLTVGVLMAQERLGWSRSVDFAVSACVAALLLAMALLSTLEFARPRSYQVVLALCGLALALALAAIVELADLLRAGRSARTTAWVAASFALLAGTVGWRRNAWIGTLLGALAGVAAYVSRSGGVSPAAAGGPVAWGWTLFVIAAGLGLLAYAAADQERGAGYLGVLTLIGFIALVAPVRPGQTETIVGWPLVLLALGGLAIVAGLRPSRPLPPEPGSGDEAPPPIELRPPGRDGPK